jgi:hypothetical protein
MRDDMPRIQPVILTTPERRALHVADICAAFSGWGGLAEPLIHCDERGDGAARATRDAIVRAAARADGGHVLLLEDVVLVDSSAPAALAATRFPTGVAAISFCDMREVPEFSPPGIYVCSALGSDGRGWWGNQALLLHRDTVAMCRREDWFSPHIEASLGLATHKAAYGDEGRNCSDIRLALLIDGCGGERRSYAVHVPSLLKHVGYDSACFPGRSMGERETRNWIGDRRRFGIDAQLEAGPARSAPRPALLRRR